MTDAARTADRRFTAALLVPTLAGLAVFGFRAAVVLLLVLFGFIIARRLLREPDDRFLRISPAFLLALLLTPALADIDRGLAAEVRWPLAPAAGAVLAVLSSSVARRTRLEPILATFLLIQLVTVGTASSRVLTPGSTFIGDVLRAQTVTAGSTRWLDIAPAVHGAIERAGTGQVLRESLRGGDRATRINQLLAGRLPPIEDVLLVGHAGTIGTTSAMAILLGAIAAAAWRVIDARCAIACVGAALLIAAVAPGLVPIDLGVFDRLTLALYVVAGTPTLFASILLAMKRTHAPIDWRARLVFAIVAGAGMAAASVYVSPAWGWAGVLLLLVPAAAWFDRTFGLRPLQRIAPSGYSSTTS